MEQKSQKSENEVADWRNLTTLSSILEHMVVTDCKQDAYHDVVLIVGDEGEKKERIPAHKLILAWRSKFFEKMLFPPQNDSKLIPERMKRILSLGNVNADAFRIVLTYMYTDKKYSVTEDNCDLDLSLKVIVLAEKYELEVLRKNFAEIVRKMLDKNPLSSIKVFQFAIEKQIRELENYSLNKILNDPDIIIKSDDFLKMKLNDMHKIVLNDNLDIEEVVLFQRVVQWARQECKKLNIDETKPNNVCHVLGDCLYAIRFPIMTDDQFTNIVKPTALLSNKSYYQLASFFFLRKSIGNKAAALETFEDEFDHRLRNPMMSKNKTRFEQVRSANRDPLPHLRPIIEEAKQTACGKPPDFQPVTSTMQRPAQFVKEEPLKTKLEFAPHRFPPSNNQPVLVGQVKPENGRVECPICHKDYAFSSYKTHMETQHGNGFPCGNCPKRFTSKKELREHWRQHKEMLRFECHHCHKILSSGVTLKTHIKNQHTAVSEPELPVNHEKDKVEIQRPVRPGPGRPPGGGGFHQRPVLPGPGRPPGGRGGFHQHPNRRHTWGNNRDNPYHYHRYNNTPFQKKYF